MIDEDGLVLARSAEEFLSYLAVERGRSRNTLAAYRRDLLAWSAYLEALGTSTEEATATEVEAFLAARRAMGAAPASVARLASVLRGYYRFGLDEGYLGGDPTQHLRPQKLGVALPKALSEAQVGALLDAIEPVDATARRDRALLELLYATGARVSEAVGLDLSDLDRSDGLLLVRGKGSKERIVPVGSLAIAALEDWLGPLGRPALVPARWQRRGDEAALFLTQRGTRLSRQGAHAVVERRARSVGLEGVTSPHVLRHSCATHLLARGADIRVVQELLGHASIATTQRYTKVDPEHLRAALIAAHPRAREPQDRS